MEDDVLVARGYLSRIFEVIDLPTNALLRSFCSLGFIGKLFKGGSELNSLAQLLRVFYQEQPCDWLVNE
jgi:N-Acetylglucosaminyltransferase-IV (GnT-IV) conserved region